MHTISFPLEICELNSLSTLVLREDLDKEIETTGHFLLYRDGVANSKRQNFS